MYLGSQSLFGETLEYTGTGKELFLGFLIVLALLITVGIIINAGNFYIQTMGSNAALIAFKVFYYLDFFDLLGYAVYRAQRYQLSRTVWRSIRFVQTGEAKNTRRNSDSLISCSCRGCGSLLRFPLRSFTGRFELTAGCQNIPAARHANRGGISRIVNNLCKTINGCAIGTFKRRPWPSVERDQIYFSRDTFH